VNLKILLPFKIFAEETSVTEVVLETTEGSVGLLPHRLDCVAALIPGILEYKSSGTSVYVAVDEGVMVKTGQEVLVSVRHAIGGADLSQLHDAVKREFLNIDLRERQVRAAEARMEGALVRRVAEFQHGR
jgi:F-type H+-transporting ATPase subunit epsilon